MNKVNKILFKKDGTALIAKNKLLDRRMINGVFILFRLIKSDVIGLDQSQFFS